MFRNLAFTAFAVALFAAPAVSLAAPIEDATLGETSPCPDISTAAMRQFLSDGSAIIIDTRTVAEFEAGHLPGARLVERTSKKHLEAVDTIAGGNKAAKLVLYCNGPFCKASRTLAGELVKAGYTDVMRYQLGMPVWRALGGVVAIERDGVARIFKADQTAVFVDTRPAAEFAKGSLAGAVNIPAEKLASATLPDDDFNRRIVLFAADETQGRRAADIMGKRPWHNISYFPGSFESLRQALTGH